MCFMIINHGVWRLTHTHTHAHTHTFVVEGRRLRLPPVAPPGCPHDYISLIADCWHHHPQRRPKMREVSVSERVCVGVQYCVCFLSCFCACDSCNGRKMPSFQSTCRWLSGFRAWLLLQRTLRLSPNTIPH